MRAAFVAALVLGAARRAGALSAPNGTSTFGCAYYASPGVLAACTSPTAVTCCSSGAQAAVAEAVFSDGIGLASAGGWATLYVATSPAFSDEQAADGAGFLEGYLTRARSDEFLQNVHGGTSTWGPQLDAFVEANLAHVAREVALRPDDAFWRHVGLVHRQQAAGFAGYRAAGGALDNATYYSATLIGDMDDLCVAFSCKRTAGWRRARALRASRGGDLRAGSGGGSAADGELLRRERFLGDGHCSALVKPLGPLSAPTDVIIGASMGLGARQSDSPPFRK